MNLIALAFGNTPLRQIGVRQYVHGILEKAVKNDERNFLLEMFLTLFNLELSPDEYDNQDIFLDRAKIHCSQIVAVRGECGVPAEFHQLAGLAAARGSYLLYNQFYTSANMVWGFLVNCKVLNDGNILPEGKFCFKELYGTNGHIEIGEIYPVGDEITSALHIQPDGDCYTQVFPDYETALKFRSVALTLVHRARTAFRRNGGDAKCRRPSRTRRFVARHSPARRTDEGMLLGQPRQPGLHPHPASRPSARGSR